MSNITITITDPEGEQRKKLDYIKKIYREDNPERLNDAFLEIMTERKGFTALGRYLIDKEYKRCQKVKDKRQAF